MLKYVITIIIFAIVVFLIKIVFPIWRFYTLSENIVSTFEMLNVLLLKAKEKEIENVESKKIALRYGKYIVNYENLNQAYEVLGKQCEKALYHAEKVSKLLANNKDFEQDNWQVTNIYNYIRSELWKNEVE